MTKRPRVRHSVSPPPAAHYLESFSHARRSVVPAHDLSIQAHEATLIPGYDHLAHEIETTREHGGRMAPWPGDGQVSIDRYDILNLLGSLPSQLPFSNPTSFPPVSFTNMAVATTQDPHELDWGMSDLGSDHEEEFYFRQMSSQERDDLDKRRKRQRLEHGRQARIKLLEQQELSLTAPVELDIEPSETQLDLMIKLDKTLSTAQNPALLELRILTNHSSDPRFEFLKTGGRWRDVWERIRRGDDVRQRRDPAHDEDVPKPTSSTTGLAGLGAYGSSDSDSDSASEVDPKPTSEAAPSIPALAIVTDSNASKADDPQVDDVRARQNREAKAAKVREWARKRQQARETPSLAEPARPKTQTNES